MERIVKLNEFLNLYLIMKMIVTKFKLNCNFVSLNYFIIRLFPLS